MRILSFQETLFISGGENTHNFSNAFISGMKGESCDMTLDVMIAGGFGFLTCGIFSLPFGPGVAFLGASVGFSFGALIGAGIAYNSYLLGRNYMQAQQLLNAS